MSRSGELFDRARARIPGGVNSPVRAYGAVGGVPRFVASARGARVTDADGVERIDYVQSWGASILGHADPRVVDAVAAAAARGTSYGAPTEGELLIAERLCAAIPSMGRVRLVSSGTEAAMTAVRLARGVTGRRLVVKFAGCYHGHADALLATAGSGLATFGIPGTPGVTEAAAAETLVVPFNDLPALGRAFDEVGPDVACVIVEAVPANMGVVPPADGFLAAVRAQCDRAGALLVLDEVITGFRLRYGGAQDAVGVQADITCLGKIVGGGLPLGAFGGDADVMDALAPAGPVYQAGTLSGNPVAVAAGLAVLDALEAEPPYERLEAMAARLAHGLSDAAAAAGVPLRVNRFGSLLSPFFTGGAVTDYASAGAQDTAAFARFFHAMLDRGIMLPPSAFEGWFLSAAHTDGDVERTIAAAGDAFLAARG